MNKTILYFLILILSGCAVAGTLPSLKEKPEQSLVDGKDEFIELFDGTIIQGKISEVSNKVMAINGNNYHVKNIKSYQYKSEYRTTVKNKFITRVVKGKINLYKLVINHGYNMSGGYNAGSSTHYYIQKGDKGNIEYFDVKTLEEMVKDNSKALYWVSEYKKLKKKNDSYLDYAIEAYNMN